MAGMKRLLLRVVGVVVVASLLCSSTYFLLPSPAQAAGIVLNPTSGPIGTTVGITGNGWQGIYTIEIYWDGDQLWSTSPDSSGNFYKTISVPSATPDTHTITAVGYNASGIPLLAAQATFTVTPLPVDLVIDSFNISPSNPTTNDEITFTAVVKNIGKYTATQSELEIKVGGETFGTIYSIPALTPGGTYAVERKETLTVAQGYVARAIADVNNAVAETNEANNETQIIFVVTAPPTYTLTINTVGNGTTTGAGTYDEGTVVPISATPASGWEFVNWTGDIATVANALSPNTTIIMDSNKAITANFSQIPPIPYTLTIYTAGAGTAAGAGTYDEGTVVPISASPASGWEFVNWTGDISTVANPNSASTTITMNENKNITANFSQIPPPPTTTTQPPPSTTTTQPPPPTTTTQPPPSTTTTQPPPPTTTTQPPPPTTTTQPPPPTTTTTKYTLTINKTGQGKTTGAGTFDEGEVVNITATETAAAWYFDYWGGNIATIGSVNDKVTTITMNGNYIITANFTPEGTVAGDNTTKGGFNPLPIILAAIVGGGGFFFFFRRRKRKQEERGATQ
jgi:hypothetical protein